MDRAKEICIYILYKSNFKYQTWKYPLSKKKKRFFGGVQFWERKYKPLIYYYPKKH